MPAYPPIREENVLTMRVVASSIAKDPKYLDHPDCPYSETVKGFFRTMSRGSEVKVPDMFEGEEELEVLDKQIQSVLNELRAMEGTLEDPQDKLTYYKTKASLIEKLIGMRERIFNLKEIAEFRETMLEMIEQTCTKDQITAIMQRLEGILKE